MDTVNFTMDDSNG